MPPVEASPGIVVRIATFGHGGWLIGLVASLVAGAAFLTGLTDGIEEYLRALQYQVHEVRPPQSQPLVIVRKDEQTGAFINRNPGRREFASILRFLGKPHRVPLTGERCRLLRLADLRIGLFSADKAIITVPSLGVTAAHKVTAGRFLSFTESLSRLAGFLELPTGGGARPAGRDDPLNVVPPDSCASFAENLRFLSFGFEIKIFPKTGHILSLSPVARIDLPTEHLVAPSSVVALDIILHGARLKEEDEMLGAAIQESEADIVLAGQSQTVTRTVTEAEISRLRSRVEADPGQASGGSMILRPDAAFMKGSAMTGFVDTRYSRNRFITALPLFLPIGAEGKVEPSFCLLTAVRTLDRTSGKPGSVIAAMWKELEEIGARRRAGTYRGGFRLPDRFIPTNAEGLMEISFMGSTQAGPKGWTRIPAVGMEECFDAAALASFSQAMPEWAERFTSARVHRTTLDPRGNLGNRVCLLGSFEVSDADFYETPPTRASPFCAHPRQLSGIEVNANAILTILEGRFLQSPDPRRGLVLTLAASMLLGLFLSYLWVSVGALVMIGAVFAAFWLASQAMHESGRILYLSPLMVSLTLTWIGTTVAHYVRQRKRAASTRAMFQKFVAASVVDAMIKNPDQVRPGGQKTSLTVFFSDLAGFSTISEMLTPEKLVELLNEYLGTMTQILFWHGGTLDKFIGDAVMAFWNFPCPQADHALRACLCALAMQDELKRLQVDWSRRGFPKVSARIGLNTADVIVGYMGAEDAQMNFTCMGDGVNLASRLEGANKEYGTLIMVSEATWQAAKDGVTARFLDLLAVKGKTEPVRVYEVVCRKGEEPADWVEHSGAYEAGLRAYLERDWAKGIGLFGAVLERWPDDGAAKNYLHRCREFLDHPPAADWDGVYRLTHK